VLDLIFLAEVDRCEVKRGLTHQFVLNPALIEQADTNRCLFSLLGGQVFHLKEHVFFPRHQRFVICHYVCLHSGILCLVANCHFNDEI